MNKFRNFLTAPFFIWTAAFQAAAKNKLNILHYIHDQKGGMSFHQNNKIITKLFILSWLLSWYLWEIQFFTFCSAAWFESYFWIMCMHNYCWFVEKKYNFLLIFLWFVFFVSNFVVNFSLLFHIKSVSWVNIFSSLKSNQIFFLRDIYRSRSELSRFVWQHTASFRCREWLLRCHRFSSSNVSFPRHISGIC